MLDPWGLFNLILLVSYVRVKEGYCTSGGRGKMWRGRRGGRDGETMKVGEVDMQKRWKGSRG